MKEAEEELEWRKSLVWECLTEKEVEEEEQEYLILVAEEVGVQELLGWKRTLDILDLWNEKGEAEVERKNKMTMFPEEVVGEAELPENNHLDLQTPDVIHRVAAQAALFYSKLDSASPPVPASP